MCLRKTLAIWSAAACLAVVRVDSHSERMCTFVDVASIALQTAHPMRRGPSDAAPFVRVPMVSGGQGLEGIVAEMRQNQEFFDDFHELCATQPLDLDWGWTAAECAGDLVNQVEE